MNQILSFLFAAVMLFACNSNKKENTENTFYMPAEWETHDAVWLGWDDDSTSGYYPGIVSLLKTLTPNVTVKMAFNSDSLLQNC